MLKILFESEGDRLKLRLKSEGRRRRLHSRGGSAPFIQYKNIEITRLRTYSCAACPKLWGEVKIERSRKVLHGKAKEELKIKMTSLTHPLGKILGLGITRGTYNVGRCLFACATAALSADIPSVDAQPYRLAFGTSVGSVDFCRMYEI